MYLTYEQYTQMGGSVDETAFTHLEYKAERLINKYSFNRIDYGLVNEKFTYSEKEQIKECTYNLVGFLSENDLSSPDHKVLVGVSNDGVSESYWAFSGKQEFDRIIENTVEDYLYNIYLDDLPVLYIGADELPKMVERYPYSI